MKTTAICFPNNSYFIPLTGTIHEFCSSSLPFNGRRWRAINAEIDITKEQKDESIKKFIEHRKNLLDMPVNKLSIVPTADCQGRCSYCYAKSNRDNNVGFIELKDLMQCMLTISDLYKTSPSEIKSVIIYGGEPFLYPEKLEQAIGIFKNSQISITTGLLFSDEIFNKLVGILNRNKNVSLSCSIDPKTITGSYNRIYFGVNDVYSFLINKIIFLVSKFSPNRIGLRMTITNNAYDFSSVLDDIFKKTGKKVSATIELIDDEEVSAQVLSELCGRFSARDDTKMLSPAKRFIFDPYKKGAFIGSFGDCDHLFGRLAIDYKGRFHACSETAAYNDDLLIFPPDFSSVEESRTTLWDKCYDCPFVFSCGGLCFAKRPTSSRCIWRQFNICEGLYHTIGILNHEDLKRAILASIGKE